MTMIAGMGGKMSSLSIISVVYNNAAFVGQAIASALGQDYPAKELILVDGGSTDDTLNIVREFGSKIASVISEPDRGVYDALNKGIARATGDIVAFLHSDDIYDAPDVASTMMKCFDDDRIDAAYGDLVYVDRLNTDRIVRNWRSGTISRLNLLTGWMPPHPAFFMRRSRYIEWGGFDTSYRIAGDYDALLRYLWVHAARCAYVERTIVRMRVGGISNRRSVYYRLLKSREDARAMAANGIPPFPAIILKPLRKIAQYW